MRHRALVAVLVAVLIGSVLPGCARRSPTQPGPQTPPSATTATMPTTPAPTPGRTTAAKPGTTPTTKAPTGLPDRLRGRDFERIPTTRPVVALTFDAGSTDAGLRPILDTLAAQHVPATFFVTGRFAERYPAGVQAIAAGGHRLGNHSYTHPYFTRQTDRQIAAELSRAEAALRGAARPLFRFPYGDRDGRTIAAVNAGGYTCVRWTVDTLGWKGTSGGVTVQTVVDRSLAGSGPGAIIMMHVGANPDDGTTLDADALPTLIARLRAGGYGFVTLDALL
jgi:peptidoglycan/xylan/chitin deacetylase (PgdA/CDA1 family)